MLQSIRDRTHGWIAGVIITLVILSFALWGIHSYLESSANTEVIAQVNGVEISKRQLASTFEPLRNQAQMNQGSAMLPEALENHLRHQALDALISIQVLKQSSLSQKYTVSEFQIDSYLERMPDFQLNGQFSLQRFHQILASNMLTDSGFLELVRTTLLIDQPRLGIVLSSVALPYEVINAIALVNQERDISYLIVPRETFLSQPFSPTPEQLQAFYQKHADEFKTPEEVTISYLALNVKDIAANIHPTDEMLKNYYNDNINSYTQPKEWNLQKILVPVAETTTADEIAAAQKKMADIQDKLKNGDDFAALAHQNPDAGDNKPDTWVSVNQLPADLQNPVQNLTKVGDVSDPIKVSNGLLLVKVVGVKDAEVQPYDAVKDKVEQALVTQKAEEKYADLREKLADLTYEHPDTLEPAAKSLGLTISTSQPFTKAKGGSDITSDKKVRDVAFTDEVLNTQNNSDAIQVSPETTVVLRVKSHTPASLLSMQTVEKQVSEQLKQQTAEQKAQDTAKEIGKKLATGETLAQLGSEYVSSWKDEGYTGRYSNRVDSAILFAAFKLPRPDAQHPYYTTVKVPAGYAVVAMRGVRDSANSGSPSPEQNDVFVDQVQTSQGVLEYKLYQKSLLAKAKIKIYLDGENQ